MVMPLLSVTVIGLVVGLVAGGATRRPVRGVLHGVLGAWAGFAVGGLVGVIVDVVAATGDWLAWLGHGGAVLGASTSFGIRPLRREQAGTR